MRSWSSLWFYSAALHQESTVTGLAARFADALADIARHAATPGTGGRTPSDFPLVELDQAAVDRITGADPRAVEDVHPLTPTQAGMLFHGLSQDGRRVYFQQLSFVLDGVSDPEAFAAAWQQVTDRTPVLRGDVVWQDVPEPLFVVRRHATVPVTHLDWRELSEDDRRQGSGTSSTRTASAASTSPRPRSSAWPSPGSPTPPCGWCGPSTT
ncbi:peptide synthetase [Streptomyces alboflavus]|uniref:Peptide synthetase n=1 Tax=Streptomyces alboflavus TaxID=67267 RepID=A0A1Z1WSP2_9ACTN|nr:peptide synthetase [Streptomyces alboflavus]